MYAQMRDLFENNFQLKQRIKQAPKIVYKYVKGDDIDAMFGEAMVRAGCVVPCARQGPGKYMFGTRNIIAKIVNNKLLIRVGGGFMSIDEFIEQYGPMEMLKIAKQEEVKQGKNMKYSKDPDSNKLGSTLGMGDIRGQMRQSMNVTETEKSNQFKKSGKFDRDDEYRVSSVAGGINLDSLKSLEANLMKEQ